MLLSLTVENWRCFKKRVRLDLTASRERTGSETLARLSSMYGTRKVLPLAALYGANGSGKTGLIDALDFMRHMVVDGVAVDRPIPIEPYRLDPEVKDQPASFEVEILVDDRVYTYGFSATRRYIVEEHLQVQRTRSHDNIFFRSRQRWHFGSRYKTDRNTFVAEGTRQNQLFLCNAISQNVNELKPIYDWFARSLQMVGIEAQYGSYHVMLLRDDFREFVNDCLRRLGPGISRLLLKDVPRESLGIPQDLLEDYLHLVTEDDARFAQLQVNWPGGSDIYIIDTDGDEPTFQKVQLAHTSTGGNEVAFDLSEESMGTQRLVKLLPMFFELASPDSTTKVYVVDELDRSFHTALTQNLITLFLASCSRDTRKQLLFTTHDLLLMRHERIRRDEQWIAENRVNEGSSIICIGTHKDVRTDTSLLKAYMSNALGGYPAF